VVSQRVSPCSCTISVKAATPVEKLPSHPGHEDAGVALVEQLAARLRVPNHLRELAVITARYHSHVHRAFELRADTVLKTLEACDALRRPERFADFPAGLRSGRAGAQGLEDRTYPQREFFHGGSDGSRCRGSDGRRTRGLTGEEIGEELRKRRRQAIEDLKRASAPA
jgi:tRNA nucleotidyltransferase (CCA-adding enzyme)